MNNEMCLRTCKGEYSPGETIYGAVYLNICSPTEASGIKISFKGIETCMYEFESDGKKTLKNEAVHAEIHQAALYSQKECFQFGCYVFPFHVEIPQDAPGSIQYKGSMEKGSWSVDISYHITAFATAADAIQAKQTVVVYPADEKALTERLFGEAQDATVDVPQLLFKNKKIYITIKLIDNYVESGTNLQLRLVITNQTKVKVTGFHVKLLRYFRLFMRDSSVKSNMLENMELLGEDCQIAPELGPHVVVSIKGSSDSVMMGNAGLDKFQIPLTQKMNCGEREEIPPSVNARHVKNRYGLEVSITFSNDHVETLSLCVPGVLPRKNKQWSSWKPPEWTFNADTKVSSSNFSVAEHLLRTEPFAALPSFQVL